MRDTAGWRNEYEDDVGGGMPCAFLAYCSTHIITFYSTRSQGGRVRSKGQETLAVPGVASTAGSSRAPMSGAKAVKKKNVEDYLVYSGTEI